MTYKHTAESQFADNEYDDALNDSRLQPADTKDSWRQRLGEYEKAGLEKPNHLVAVMTPVTVGLLDTAVILQRAIATAVAAKSPTIADVAGLESTMNMFLRTTRQIERFANFETRVEAAEIQAKNAGKAKPVGKRDYSLRLSTEQS